MGNRKSRRWNFPFPIPRSRFPLFRRGEIVLEDALSRDGIETGSETRATRACRTQRVLGIVRREALVRELHFDPEAPAQALGEAAGEPADGMIAPVLAGRQADDRQHGPPLG